MAFNERQKRFIAAYVANPNATQAAIAAGYSADTAHSTGPRLLEHAGVRAEIDRIVSAATTKALSKYEVTREKIVAELAKMAFANMGDYTAITDAGDLVLDMSEVTRDQLAAVKEVTSDVYMEGRGDAAERVKRTKFSLHDKRASLMDLAKLEGHVVDRQQLTGVNGGPIQTINAHVVDVRVLDPEKREMLRHVLEAVRDGDEES